MRLGESFQHRVGLPALRARRTINPPDDPSGTSARRRPTSRARELRGRDHARVSQTRANPLTAFVGLGMDDVCGIDGVADAFHQHRSKDSRVLSVHANSLADGLNGDACLRTLRFCGNDIAVQLVTEARSDEADIGAIDLSVSCDIAVCCTIHFR